MIEAREGRKVERTQSERTHQTDKKKNAAYWDKIDGILTEAIVEVAKYSDIELSEEDVEEATYEVLGEVRDLVIATFENRGGVFPFVKGDM